jgi:hypothetical protein
VKTDKPEAQPKRLRAIIEFCDGELLIYPVGESDVDRAEIIDALRIYLDERSK